MISTEEEHYLQSEQSRLQKRAPPAPSPKNSHIMVMSGFRLIHNPKMKAELSLLEVNNAE